MILEFNATDYKAATDLTKYTIKSVYLKRESDTDTRVIIDTGERNMLNFAFADKTAANNAYNEIVTYMRLAK